MEPLSGKVRVDTLFALARSAAREADLEEVRTRTRAQGVEQRSRTEDEARSRELAQMREVTRAQLGMALSARGVTALPILLPGADPNAAHIQAAARR